jgi:hypothetical protein
MCTRVYVHMLVLKILCHNFLVRTIPMVLVHVYVRVYVHVYRGTIGVVVT